MIQRIKKYNKKNRVMKKNYRTSCTVSKACNILIYVLIYWLISYHRWRENRTQMTNLTVRVSDENAFECWKEEEMDGDQIAVRASLMLWEWRQEYNGLLLLLLCLCYPLSERLIHQNEKTAKNITLLAKIWELIIDYGFSW